MSTDVKTHPGTWTVAGGERGRLVQEMDWPTHPLGAVEGWPCLLRTMVDVIVGSSIPSIVLWGPELYQLYNDAAGRLTGLGHRDAMGAKALETWEMSWPEISGLNRRACERVFAGETVDYADQVLPACLGGELQEGHFDVCYSPLRMPDGEVAGVLVTLTDVTEYKRAQRDLGQSNRRLGALIEATAESTYRMSADWSEMRQMAGGNFLADTADSKNWLEEYIPPEEQERVTRAIAQSISSETQFEMEHLVRLHDGTQEWTHSLAIPVRDEDGVITEWFGAATDITLRKRADERVRTNEERQAFLLRLSDALRPVADPIKIQEISARFLGEHLRANRVHYAEVNGEYAVVERGWSEGLEPMVGRFRLPDFGERMNRGHAAGETVLSHDTSCDPDIAEAERKVLAGYQIGAYLTVPLYKERTWVAIFAVNSIRPRQWSASDVQLVEDVAERTWAAVERARVEAALGDSEERFRVFVQNVREYALIRTDDIGLITNWNPGAERLFGYSSEEILYQPFQRLLSAQDVESGVFDREMATVVRTSRNEDLRRLVRKDGSEFWAYWVSEAIHDQDGKFTGMVKVLHDETENQKTEEHRRRLSEATTASLREKEELLKEVHHRVKNNLQVITSLVNLQSKQVPEGKVRALFDETRNRILSMASIHERLYQSANLAQIGLLDYARQIVPELVRFYGAEERIRIETAGDADGLELERAVPFGLLLNELVSNSLKHAFPDGRPGVIRIEIRKQGQETHVVVADDGAGLPQGFDFQRSTSLGLKLSRTLTRQLGGEITLLSGKGTTVVVKFPSTEEWIKTHTGGGRNLASV